jgi:tetratricopeptide (TPR) repeat protein
LFTSSRLKSVIGGVLTAALLASTFAFAQEKNWKDQAEYDLYSKMAAATNPDEQLNLLKQWEEKYPESDYKLERAQAFLVVYNKKNDGQGVYDASKRLLSIDPNSFQSLYMLTLLTISLNKTDAAGLETGVKAANGMIAALDSTFAADKRPANITEEQWKKQRNDTEVLALKTLGWVEQQKKNYPAAEKYFRQALDKNNENAEMSYFLGTVIALQKEKDLGRQAEAMWHFARAGNLDGAGALDPTRKSQIAKYFERVFKSFAGDDDADMKNIINQAKASPYPPPGFKIESKEEKMAKNEEKFKAENPNLYMFMKVKEQLVADGGETYWQDLKDAELPELKGKIVSMSPETNPKEIVVAITTADTPEVTIVLDTALRGKAEPGTELTFVGVAKEYSKDPFTLKVEVDDAKLKGWPAQAAPAKKAAPAAKKPAVKKK